MPTVPTSTKCKELGCTNPKATLSSSCTAHGGRDTYDHQAHNSSPARKAFTTHYLTRQWRSLRNIQLSRHPLCAACISRHVVAPAKHVDHIFPWAQIGEHAFMFNIYQSLCAGCHTSKTLLERRGIFRRYTGDGHIDYGIGDYSRIVGDR